MINKEFAFILSIIAIFITIYGLFIISYGVVLDLIDWMVLLS